jgi:NADP-dependent 3-hydroxy acid dehydrogenase YdfG/Flp pilus assembly protein TadD
MSNQNIAVAYCADNETVVKSLIEPLQSTNYQFKYYSCNRSTSKASLSKQLLEQPAPVLLFISDNFLKSAQCMSHALQLLNEKRKQLLPIVIDGLHKDEDTGELVSVKTDFDRVSDIIQYINYWQDQYLDLRRQKRQLEGLDEDKFNEHLKVMREVSSEAGEFLRLLRTMIYLNQYEFQANHYEQFFLLVDDESSWSRFKSQHPNLEPQIEVTEAPAVNLSDIPGADMLGLGEEAPQEIEKEQEEQEETKEEVSGAHSPVFEIEEMGPESPGEDSGELEEDASVERPMEIFIENQEAEEEDEEETPFTPEPEEAAEEEEEMIAEEEPEEDEEDEVEDPASLVEAAMNYFNTGQVQEGLAFMGHAVEKYPYESSLRYHYALFLAQKTENYALAIEELEPVLEQETEDENALFLMGELQELEDNFKEARTYYERLLNINPDYPNAYYRLGMILSAHYEEEATTAAGYFKQASEQNKDNADAFYQYGLLLNDPIGRPKKAVKYLKKTVKINPEHPFAYYDMALIYHQLGKPEKAHKAYKNAIEVNPEFQTPENDLAFSKPPAKEEKAKTKSKKDKKGAGSAFDMSFTHDALESMKNNMKQLEEMLRSSEEETAMLRAALHEQEQEEELPERPEVDKTVFITGATSGIGKSTAEKFAEAGYRVIITGRRTERLRELQAALTENYGVEVLPIAFDVRDLNGIREVASHLQGKWAEIDILVNNAGKAKGLAPIHEGEVEHWEEMIDTNIKGLLYLTRTLAPYMVERQQGHIINVCSTAGKEVYPNGNVYCATKFAVDGLTKAMRMDLHQHNVRVSMVSPAHVDETEFALVRFDGDSTRAQIYEDFKPLSSSDVADTIYYIASQPAHVNILDVVMQGTQQAHSMVIDRSGREKYEEE